MDKEFLGQEMGAEWVYVAGCREQMWDLQHSGVLALYLIFIFFAYLLIMIVETSDCTLLERGIIRDECLISDQFFNNIKKDHIKVYTSIRQQQLKSVLALTPYGLNRL